MNFSTIGLILANGAIIFLALTVISQKNTISDLKVQLTEVSARLEAAKKQSEDSKVKMDIALKKAKKIYENQKQQPLEQFFTDCNAAIRYMAERGTTVERKHG